MTVDANVEVVVVHHSAEDPASSAITRSLMKSSVPGVVVVGTIGHVVLASDMLATALTKASELTPGSTILSSWALDDGEKVSLAGAYINVDKPYGKKYRRKFHK